MAFNPENHMIDLKGKQYLQVMWRLVWFREEHPDFGIKTELVRFDPERAHAIFHCEITDANGMLLSSGYGSESARDFGDFIEKAETKAVGRALAMLGYGTQFAPELDEGERIVDSPVSRLVCAGCGKPITQKISDFSTTKYGRPLCMDCQKKRGE